MTRALKVQLDVSSRCPRIGRRVRAWPVSGSLDSESRNFNTYTTIADIVQARKPEVGAVYVVILIAEENAPNYGDMIDRGSFYLIGHYRSAAERHALLLGERIENGKHE